MKYKLVVKILLIIIAIVIAILVNLLVLQSDKIQLIINSFSYTGVFIISFFSGFNLIVPIPAISFLPSFSESGLNIILSIIIITVGMTAGDMAGYLLGDIARSFKKQKDSNITKIILRMENRKSILPILFLLLYSSFAPLPNELIVIPLAFLGYKFTKIFPTVLFGNLVFNSLYSIGILGFYDLYFKIIS